MFAQDRIRRLSVIMASVGGIAFTGAGLADVIYVNDDATGANNGSSWQDAYTDLQDAIFDAGVGDEIWVAAGVYRPTIPNGDRHTSFVLVTGVAWYGGFNGTENNLNERAGLFDQTILSGDLNNNDGANFSNYGENSHHVVRGSSLSSSTIIDGFAIEGGNANVASGNSALGAGMFLDGASSPRIANITFRDNTVEWRGGGIYIAGGSAEIEDCAFIGNRSMDVGGAGAYLSSATPSFTRCRFENNEVIGLGDFGGALACLLSDATLTDCVFIGNVADVGGAVYNGVSSPTFVNCEFYGNGALGLNGYGGAMYNFTTTGPADPTLINCVFSGNVADRSGGAMLNTAGGGFPDSAPTIINCSFTENEAGVDGGGIMNGDFLSGGSPVITNSIFWNNRDSSGSGSQAQIFTEQGDPVVNYSVVDGGWSGSGGVQIVNADPQFVDANGADNQFGTEDDDLRLSAGSPAIDAGDNTAVPNDITTDLDGNARFVDDPNTLDTGNGTPPFVDFGAYEFGASGGGLVLEIEPCGRPGRVVIRNATPNGRVALIGATGAGGIVIPPGNPCAGTQLGLDRSAQLVRVDTANQNGRVVINAPNIPCGRFVQALDVETCATSNVVETQ